MLLRLVSSWIFVEKKRKLVDVFPEPVRKAWNEWELRVMVLLSLALQISLLFYGGRRKYISSRRFRIFICSAYLLADLVPTIALGVLSNSQGITSSCSCSGANKSNPVDEDGLTAFWASFFLLHLGGPDTITAYAFADNELWIRHLFGLVVQTFVAIYIILKAWQGTWLSFLAIPMFLVGTIKYGERTWALRLASRDQFSYWVREPGPNYANFMEEMRLKMIEGYRVSANEVIEVDAPLSPGYFSFATISDDAAILLKARSFLNTSRLLFLDLVISFRDREASQLFFNKLMPITAFRVIEVELGFAYDIFYTKVPINYTRWGFFLRFITSFLTFFVFVAFPIVVRLNLHKHLLVDLVISYILLGGAIILQLTEFLILLSSDWTSLWLSEHCKPLVARAISCLLFQPKQKNRWSKSMNQYNLLTYCLKQKPLFPSGVVTRLLPFHENLTSMIQKLRGMLENVRQLKIRKRTSNSLDDLMFKHFQKKSISDPDFSSLYTCRGGAVLEQHHLLDEFGWTTNVEFDHSILIWHIATDLCYRRDVGQISKELTDNLLHSKQLADYMLYLLVMCPLMMPKGIGMIRFRDTCAEAIEYFTDKGLKSAEEACDMLLQVSTHVPPAKVTGGRNKSVLFEACRLAQSLQQLGNKEMKWEVVSNVWVEMLGYAANNCRGYYHAQQLQEGGELLTHVWLLMSHLGITQQFELSYGYSTTKLAWK